MAGLRPLFGSSQVLQGLRGECGMGPLEGLKTVPLRNRERRFETGGLRRNRTTHAVRLSLWPIAILPGLGAPSHGQLPSSAWMTDRLVAWLDVWGSYGTHRKGLQAELLSGFEAYVPMSRECLCSHDTYCRFDIHDHFGHLSRRSACKPIIRERLCLS